MRGAEPYERWVRRTDGPLLALSLLFLAVFLAPLYEPTMPVGLERGLRALSGLLWLAFALDYAMRLRLAPDRRRYVRGHIPDLLTIALPMLRPLRVLRLIGLFGSATRRASQHAQAKLTGAVVGIAALIMVTGGGVVLDAERGANNANITTAEDALWWAATTVTTVGYGDRFPITGQGRIAAVVLMLTGIALLGVVTASVAAWFVRQFASPEEAPDVTSTDALALAEIAARLERIEAKLAFGAARSVPDEAQVNNGF